jgi:hypothetical protein
VTWEQTEADYPPVAVVEQLANKAVVMKATIKDMLGTVIATARKKETEVDFP